MVSRSSTDPLIISYITPLGFTHSHQHTQMGRYSTLVWNLAQTDTREKLLPLRRRPRRQLHVAPSPLPYQMDHRHAQREHVRLHRRLPRQQLPASHAPPISTAASSARRPPSASACPPGTSTSHAQTAPTSPKSDSLKLHALFRSPVPRRRMIRMLSGFTSRCANPRPCSHCSAPATCHSSSPTSSSVSRDYIKPPPSPHSLHELGDAPVEAALQLDKEAVLLAPAAEVTHRVRRLAYVPSPRLPYSARSPAAPPASPSSYPSFAAHYPTAWRSASQASRTAESASPHSRSRRCGACTALPSTTLPSRGSA